MSKELKTGIIAIAAIFLGIWGYNFLKGQDILSSSSRSFSVEYANISGLSQNSNVTINGFVVGKVKTISFSDDPNKKGRLIVDFYVNNDFEFSKNSIVKIYSASPLGGSNLSIEPSYEGVVAKSGDFLKGVVEPDMISSLSTKLDPIQLKLGSVLVRTDSMLLGLNQILDPKARKGLNNGLIGLEGIVYDVRKTLNSLNSILDSNKSDLTATISNTKNITDNFAKVSKDLENANIAGLSKELAQTLASLNHVISGIKNGKGSLGKLANDEKMYTNLTNASKELEELLREVKLNPKRFIHFSVFGKKPKPYSPSNNKLNKSNN